ncbi:hypothetical protein AMAG_07333 [Allomyces macrogynus ATCC 38327]|uniref:Peptidase S8/S53 domain-containing protein n=1 Tax=Allomyces macrogynus (strain ATCC 38327) TaxID=578462 RepID=A0A0L0SHZ9_ALLM3|nr:hypothetical protein AMAG_07333 [Allomyces macrogynus ATCC 38327]|eukprot:KNE62079.1 hypothetical protein AMAG_07333 [Allomyces macrogynus ATCC 38327]
MPRPMFLAALLALVLLGGTTIHAAPADAGQWMVELDPSIDIDTAQSAIRDFYATEGYSAADALGAEILTIGDGFRVLSVPAGPDDEMRKRLGSVGGVSQVETEARWELHAPVVPDVPYGLVRIGHVFGDKNTTVNLPKDGGEGVDIYVVDSGVDTKHPEFEGRATVIDMTGEGPVDVLGHGTHTAATCAGKTFGVAKRAHVIGVKVLGKGGFGTDSTIYAGLAAITDRVKQNPTRPAVINMSMGSKRTSDRADSIKRRAIQALTRLGIAVVVSAGNDHADACKYTPAFVPEAITVGAIDAKDTFAGFSNFGACVDVVAPGVNIESAKANSDGKFTNMTGTSMAAPHVAGAMAVLRGLNMTLDQATQTLIASARSGEIKGQLLGTPNRLLFLNPQVIAAKKAVTATATAIVAKSTATPGKHIVQPAISSAVSTSVAPSPTPAPPVTSATSKVTSKAPVVTATPVSPPCTKSQTAVVPPAQPTSVPCTTKMTVILPEEPTRAPPPTTTPCTKSATRPVPTPASQSRCVRYRTKKAASGPAPSATATTTVPVTVAAATASGSTTSVATPVASSADVTAAMSSVVPSQDGFY